MEEEKNDHNEWYTRPQYIEAARLVMGSISLDPASSVEANRIVKADKFYTREQNGLAFDWIAPSVWLNPPYGRSSKMTGQHLSTIKLFVDKCISSYKQGKIEQAIILVTTEVNAKWFYPLWNYPICFPNHRVNFIVRSLPKSGKYTQMFGSCFVYLGNNDTSFVEVFSKFGRIVSALDTPEPEPSMFPLWEDGIAG